VSALACIAVADTDPWTGLRRLAHFAERLDQEEGTANAAAAPWCIPLEHAETDISLCWPGQSGRLLYPIAWMTPHTPIPPEAAESWRIAQLVGAAISGAKLNPAAFTATPLHTLAKQLVPAAETPAFPADLPRPGGPRIWVQPLQGPAGAWTLVALFNPDAADTEITLDLRTLGLDADAYYTVFECWPDRYHGLAHRDLQFKLPPFSQRLIGLRPAEDRPMLLACTTHWSMGARNHGPVRWDFPSRTFSGTLQPPADTDCALHFLIPEEYTLEAATLDDAPLPALQQGRTLRLEWHSGPSPQQSTWKLRFVDNTP
jgi:hypothetical protein